MSSVATQALGYVRKRTVAFAMPSSSSYRNPSMNSSHHEDCLIVHVELRPFQGTQMDLHSGKWCRAVGKKKRPAQKSQDIILIAMPSCWFLASLLHWAVIAPATYKNPAYFVEPRGWQKTSTMTFYPGTPQALGDCAMMQRCTLSCFHKSCSS